MSITQVKFDFGFDFNAQMNQPEGSRMYQIPAYKVTLVRDSSQLTYSQSRIIRKPGDVNDIAQEYLKGTDREHFVVIMLNTKNSIIGIHTVAIGILSSCPVHPREVFKAPIVAGAAGVILVHNHPSGDPKPSEDDIKLTKRIIEAGEILGISVMDHVIIGEECFHSLKEYGEL